MSRRHELRVRMLLAAASISMLAMPTGWAQTAVSGTEALRRFEATFVEVKDFTATIEADIDMERIRIPRMSATLYFKRPDKIRYTSPGFALFPREGMVLDPAALRERYSPTTEGRDTIDGRVALRLALEARDAKNRLSRMTLWLDPVSWTPVKLETTPYGARKLQVEFAYEHIQSRYWLPRAVTIQFQIADDADMALQPGEPARAAPRKGTMKIRYLEYMVNSGLSDDVFIDSTGQKGTQK